MNLSTCLFGKKRLNYADKVEIYLELCIPSETPECSLSSHLFANLELDSIKQLIQEKLMVK